MTLLLDAAIRATLIAGSTAALLWALRIRTAVIRHAAWTFVLAAMLLLPVWSAAGLKMPMRVLRPSAPAITGAPNISLPAITSDPVEAGAPAVSSVGNAAHPFDWERFLILGYFVGAVVLLARLIVGTIRATQLRRRALLARGRATSDLCTTPITVGFLRPTLILPSSWQRWPSAQLNAVLAHENEHARRRDPLVQWVALFNRTVFWFHPLAWWLERRLATLAEEACDAAVLAAGNSPQEYSEYLLEMARQVTHQGGRVRSIGMAMPGSGLKPRLKQILDGLPPAPVSRARLACTIACCALSSMFLATGTLAERVPTSQDPAAASARFAVASIKPCEGGGTTGPVAAGGLGTSGGGVSLNTITVRCQTVIEMIARSYMMFGNPPPLNTLNRFDPEKVSGGPAWARSERFAIEAKADGTPGPAVMMGAMLRALLEERFQLKLHEEFKDVPAFALTVATTGLKLKPVDPSSCIADSIVAGASPSANDKPRCNSSLIFNGPNRTFKSTGQSFDRVSQHLGPMLFSRLVVDQTSTAGLFSFSIDFAPDDSTPALTPAPVDSSNAPLAPSVFTAFEKLGLKFVATKAKQGQLVIDRLSRPSPNGPAPVALR